MVPEFVKIKMYNFCDSSFNSLELIRDQLQRMAVANLLDIFTLFTFVLDITHGKFFSCSVNSFIFDEL